MLVPVEKKQIEDNFFFKINYIDIIKLYDKFSP